MAEPVDATEAPMLMQIFKHIADDGLRLAYGGSGPDEIFDGYGLASAFNNTKASAAETYFSKFMWLFDVNPELLLPETYNTMKAHVTGKLEGITKPYANKTTSKAQLAQHINLQGRMQAYEFNELDLTSMAHSVEARSPLIATPVIEAAFSFNPELKNHNNTPKWIYKEAWRGIVPDAFIDRPKAGFPTPMEFWFSEAYEAEVEETLFDSSAPLTHMGLLDTTYLKQCWENKTPFYRCVFYRLFCLNLMLAAQNNLRLNPLSQSIKRYAA